MTTKIHTRNITLFLYSIVLIIIILQLMACGGSKSDPTPATPATSSAEDAVKTKLTSATWKIQSVSVDGVDQSGVYKGLTIKFDGSTFTATNGGAVWPSSGTWSFTATDGTKIKRDDGIEVNVEVTDTTLKLTLTWTKTTLSGGRVESLKGQNVFSFTK